MWYNCLFHVTLFSWQYHNSGSLWAPLGMIGWILRSILLSPTDSLLECPGVQGKQRGLGLMWTSSVQEAEGTTEAHRCHPLQAGGLGWQKRKRAVWLNRKACGRQPQLDSNLKLLVDQSTLEREGGDAGSRAGRDFARGFFRPHTWLLWKLVPPLEQQGDHKVWGPASFMQEGEAMRSLGQDWLTVCTLSAPSSCVPTCLMLGLWEKPANKQTRSAQLFICDYLKYMVLESRGKTGRDVSKFSINNSNVTLETIKKLNCEKKFKMQITLFFF